MTFIHLLAKDLRISYNVFELAKHYLHIPELFNLHGLFGENFVNICFSAGLRYMGEDSSSISVAEKKKTATHDAFISGTE